MFTVLFIAPVPTPPTSYRTEDTSGSDHGTTVHVNIPSAGSVRDGIPQTAAEQAELAVRIGTAFHHFILFFFSYVLMVLTINWMNVSHVCRYCIFSPCCCFKGELLFDLYIIGGRQFCFVCRFSQNVCLLSWKPFAVELINIIELKSKLLKSIFLINAEPSDIQLLKCNSLEPITTDHWLAWSYWCLGRKYSELESSL